MTFKPRLSGGRESSTEGREQQCEKVFQAERRATIKAPSCVHVQYALVSKKAPLNYGKYSKHIIRLINGGRMRRYLQGKARK